MNGRVDDRGIFAEMSNSVQTASNLNPNLPSGYRQKLHPSLYPESGGLQGAFDNDYPYPIRPQKKS
jgi:hypothetical protein